MTNKQILELASNHLRYFEDGWRGTPEQLLKFARELYNGGYFDGYDDGYDIGTLDMVILERKND